MRELVAAWGWLAVLTTATGLTSCGDRDGKSQGAGGSAAVRGDPELGVLEEQARSYAAVAPGPPAPSLKAPFTRAQYEVVRALCMLDWRYKPAWRHHDAGARIGVMRTIRVLPISAPTRARLAAVAPREWSFESFALRERVLSEVTTTPEEHRRLGQFSLVACAPLFDRWDACLPDPMCSLVPDTEPAPAEPAHPQGDFGPGDSERAALVLQGHG